MTAPAFQPEIIARAEAMLLPVAAELASMTEDDANRWRNVLCRHLAEDDALEAEQTIIRIRSSLKARAAAAAIAKKQAEAARVEDMKAALLSDPHMATFLHALAVELLHEDTRPETVRDATPELPRLFRKLRP